MRDGRIIKRSVSIAGHATSVSLEEAFWAALRACAAERNMSVQALVGEIDAARKGQNLSSAIRVFVLRNVRPRSLDALRPKAADAAALAPPEANS